MAVEADYLAFIASPDWHALHEEEERERYKAARVEHLRALVHKRELVAAFEFYEGDWLAQQALAGTELGRLLKATGRDKREAERRRLGIGKVTVPAFRFSPVPHPRRGARKIGRSRERRPGSARVTGSRRAVSRSSSRSGDSGDDPGGSDEPARGRRQRSQKRQRRRLS